MLEKMKWGGTRGVENDDVEDDDVEEDEDEGEDDDEGRR